MVVNLDNDYKAPSFINLRMQVTGIDPIKGDVTLRVIPEPRGEYSLDSIRLTLDIKIYTNSSLGRNELEFAKGKKMDPFEVTMDMYDGSVMEYPYDSHWAYLSMLVVSDGKDSAGKDVETKIPIVKETNFYASMQGYKIAEVDEYESGVGHADIDFKIERTDSVRMVSTFITVLMWFITVAMILVLGSIIIRKRKVEYGMFGFLSAMLFALPALRNIQPFVPTFGCLSDYMAFFWAELTAAVGLIFMIATWLKRSAQKHDEAHPKL
jgi:hypothetical protein